MVTSQAQFLTIDNEPVLKLNIPISIDVWGCWAVTFELLGAIMVGYVCESSVKRVFVEALACRDKSEQQWKWHREGEIMGKNVIFSNEGGFMWDRDVIYGNATKCSRHVARSSG